VYVMVRKYAGKGSLMDRLAPKIRDDLVPLLKAAPGFKSYCAFASDDGHIVSVSVFANQSSAEAANDRVRQWVTPNLRDALPDPPEVLAGEVRHEIPTEGQGNEDGLYVTIREYDGVRSIERLAARAAEHVMPVLRHTPGLRGHYVFATGQDQDRVVAVSMFDGRANAMAVSGLVIGIMREKAKDLAPNPPRVISGKAAVAVMA
jgi:hypothetical protein